MKLRIVTLALSALAAVAASAQVSSISLNEGHYNVQTADGTTSAGGAFLDVFLNASMDDVDSGALTTPHGDTFVGVGDNAGTLRFSAFYVTAAQLALAAPAGDYTLDVDGGNLAGLSGTLSAPSLDFPDAIPTLTGDSYTRLQAFDPAADLTLSLNTFTLGGSGDAYVYINDALGGSPFHQFGLGTSLTIPANTLTSGHQYSMFLAFATRPTADASFDGDAVTGFANLYETTSVDFTVAPVPEPASLAALGLGVAAMRRRRRK